MADIDAPIAWRMQQDGYLMQINQLRDENAELRAEVEQLREENQSIGMAAYELGRKSMADENAKLREQVERLHAEQVYWELGNCPGCPNVADLQEALEQNSKLRELGRSAVRCITDVPDCDLCALGEQVSGVWICHFIRAAKELGIEVD